MNLMLIVEIIVAALLVGTFSMCIVLNRRLGNLRSNQDEMRRLIGEFDKALSKARVGMADLKSASAAVDSAHEERMKQAKALRDELGFMIETADRLADRLAGEAAGNRQFRTERAEAAARPRQERAEPEAAPVRPSAPPPRRAPEAPATAGAAGRFKVEPRSEAERELLMALRQAR